MTGPSTLIATVGPVLAHQGGWDEMLLVGAPIAAFAALLWVANRRADAGEEADSAGEADNADAASGAETDDRGT